MQTPSSERDKFLTWTPGNSFWRNISANVFTIMGWVISTLLVLSIFSGPFLLVFSIYQYFKTGVWIYYDNAAILYCFDGLREWLLKPASWYGLHKIVNWMFSYLPMGLLTILIGVPLAVVAAGFLFGTGMELQKYSPNKRESHRR